MLILKFMTVLLIIPTTLGEIGVFNKQLNKYPKCGQANFQEVRVTFYFIKVAQ